VPLIAHEDCVLVVVDAQPGFADADGSEQALDRAAWLVALARALAVPIVVTEEEPARNGPTDPRIELAPDTPVCTKPTFGLGVRLTHCKALAYEWVRTVERSTALLSSDVLGPAPFRL
jgi:nicotinamidase-related amidase